MTDARTITSALGGRWSQRYGCAPCPVCQPEMRRDQNALTLADGSDGRILAHCKKSGCDFREILSAAGVAPRNHTPPDPACLARRKNERRAKAEKRARQAERLWQEAQPIANTLAEHYLREARGITCSLPATLRFAPSCWHGPTAKRYPAMLARVQGGDSFGVHRTFIRADGRGKAGLDGGDKLMLGSISGGAVCLAHGQGPLLAAEGIETTFSAFVLLGNPNARAWASLSAPGLVNLRLPDRPGRLVIAPDGDKTGHAAALTLADRAACMGWVVSLLTPPPGGDFNDVILERATI